MTNEDKWCIISYHGDGHVGQVNFTKLMQNDELVRDDQSCFVIECEIDNEDAIHAVDLFENDDAFLEVLGARIEYPTRHEKRAHKHYSDIHAYFGESMETKLKDWKNYHFLYLENSPTPICRMAYGCTCSHNA